MAEGDCDTIKYIGGMPSYPGNLYSAYSVPSKCRAIALGGPMVPRFSLQKYDYSTSTWSTTQGPSTTYYFVVSDNGLYRLLVELPTLRLATGCGEHEPGPILIYNLGGQWVGYGGYWSGSYYSNSVIVGKTIPADISYSFIDIPETGSNLAYDYLEHPIMDLTQCHNYDLWWLAIFESGPTYNRYWSYGWQTGPGPSSIDLQPLWDQGLFWEFLPYHSYTVQFAIENQNCINSSWNNLDKTFFICPFGTGCRLGEDQEPIYIAPNPANSSIKLLNFTLDIGRQYNVYITDILGRSIKKMRIASNEVDVSDLNNGIFTLSLVQDNQVIYVSKLAITH